MSNDIRTLYPGRVNPADADYPFGSIKNESVPGANDGTPLTAEWGNDFEALKQAAFRVAGTTPNGTTDTALVSQLYDALKDHSTDTNRNEVGAHDAIYTRGYPTVAVMLAEAGQLEAGVRVNWRGYYTESDGGSNWGIVRKGDTSTVVDDGGSIFIAQAGANGTWIEANHKGKKLNVRKWGGRGTNELNVTDVDDTVAIENTVNYGKYGAVIYIPSGRWQVKNKEIALWTGQTILGESAGENVDGAPPASQTRQSYLYNSTPGNAVFKMPGGQNAVNFERIAIGGSVQPVPIHDPVPNTYGIRVAGQYPNNSFQIGIDRCIFYNLFKAISLEDTTAGPSDPTPSDFNCAPIHIWRSRFFYCQTGIYLNSNQCDDIDIRLCNFNIPVNGIGIELRRYGHMSIANTIAGGENGSGNNNTFLLVNPVGAGAVDNIVLDSVQVEQLDYFIDVRDYDYLHFNIDCRNCISEIDANTYLRGNVQFKSTDCRWSNVEIFIDSPDVKVSSYDDEFVNGARYSFLQGSPRDVFQNARWSVSPPPSYGHWKIDNGVVTAETATVSAPNNTPTAAFVLDQNNSAVRVSACIENSALANIATIVHTGNQFVIINEGGSSSIFITVSGTGVFVEQNTGVTQTINCTLNRVA